MDQHIKTDPIDYLMSSEAMSNEELPPFAAELYDKARELYASMVFWNMPIRRNMGGYRAAIIALNERGDLAAARLADRMEKAINHAS